MRSFRQPRRHTPQIAVGFLSLAGIFVTAEPPFAQAPKVPPPLPVTRLDERTVISNLDAPHAVTLSLSKELPIKETLLLLVRATSFSLVIEEGVEGTFAGELKDLTLRQSLEAILFPSGLDYSIDGNVIRVHRRRPALRLYDVSYLNVQRQWQRSIKQPAADLRASVTADYFTEIERGVAALLSVEGKAHVDRHNALVQVTDFADRLDRIAVYLESVHVRAVRQVRLDARVIEVTLFNPRSHAVNWTQVTARAGEPWDATRATAGVKVSNFNAVLAALAEQGEVRVVAAPRLLAMNNEPAVITPAQGLTLSITSYIAPDGMIQLSVSPTYSTPATTADADTLVRIADGETVLLSGMLQPRTAARETTELIILLSATVVTPAGSPASAR